MACRKCGVPKKTAWKTASEPEYLARCLDCTSGLTTQSGLTVPVHLIEVAVKLSDIQAWQEQGHEIEYRPL